MGKKSNLKAALSSQQNRLKQNSKAKESALRAQKQIQTSKKKGKGLENGQTRHITESKDGKGKARADGRHQQKVTIPFQSTDTILLIGEGNFSFALALSSFSQSSSSSASEYTLATPTTSAHPLAHLPPQNITATAYDTSEECYSKYPEAEMIVEKLKSMGAEVLFGVDGTQLEKSKVLKGRKWDRVVWNFPHAGRGITDQDRNILANQTLLLGFLHSVSPFLKQGTIPDVQSKNRKRKRSRNDSDDEEEADDTVYANKDDCDEDDLKVDPESDRTGCRGTVLITLRNVPPYSSWNLPSLAKHPPKTSLHGQKGSHPTYTQLRSFVFHRDSWPGYEHRMTKGERAHGTGTTGTGGEDRTWEFCLRD